MQRYVHAVNVLNIIHCNKKHPWHITPPQSVLKKHGCYSGIILCVNDLIRYVLDYHFTPKGTYITTISLWKYHIICLFSWWNWLGKHSSNIWNLVSLCLMRCIWRECNRRTFEDLDRSEDQLLALFSGSLFDWARAWGLTSSDSIPFFLNSLLLCN